MVADDPNAVRRVAQALDARLKQYALDVEPMDPRELAKIAIAAMSPARQWGDIVIVDRGDSANGPE